MPLESGKDPEKSSCVVYYFDKEHKVYLFFFSFLRYTTPYSVFTLWCQVQGGGERELLFYVPSGHELLTNWKYP